MGHYIDNATYNYLMVRLSELLEDVQDLKRVIADLEEKNDELRQELKKNELKIGGTEEE